MSAVLSNPRMIELFGYKFKGISEHLSGDIPFSILGLTPVGGTIMMWELKEGTSYPPEQHKHPHSLFVICGEGVIDCKGILSKYGPGSVFHTEPNDPHGFVKVMKTTWVLESVPRKN